MTNEETRMPPIENRKSKILATPLNPVLLKDLLGLLRLKRVAAMQIAFVATLTLMLLASWPQGGVLTLAASENDHLFLGLILAQAVLLILFVPGIAAVAISGEREANTLEMLYASRLSPLQIIVGKLAFAISYPMLLLISGLPFVALLMYRGAVSAGDLLSCYLILIVSAVLLGLLSLTVSSVFRQSSTSLVVAYLLVLTLCGAVLVPAALMFSRAGDAAAAIHYARSLSPIAAILSLLRPQLGGLGDARQLAGLEPAWRIFLPAAAGLIVLCVLIVVWRLSRPPSSSEILGGGADRQHSRIRRMLVLIDPKKQRSPIGARNPVLVKERRTSNLRSGRWMIRIFYASLLLSLALASMTLAGGAEYEDLLANVALVLTVFQIGLIGLVTPSLTSPAISDELESGNFEMLRMTRLSPWRIFWGKLRASLGPALLPVLALLPAFGVVCFVDEGYLRFIPRLVPVALLAAVVCCLLGLVCSSFTASTARATVAAYLLTATLFVVPLAGWWLADVQLSRNAARWICLPSPLVMSIYQLPAQAITFPQLTYLWKTHLCTMGALCLVLLLVARIRLNILMERGPA
jgi:ABC-type transport system involved in multi-copper enzyme maturation permease subunit